MRKVLLEPFGIVNKGDDIERFTQILGRAFFTTAFMGAIRSRKKLRKRECGGGGNWFGRGRDDIDKERRGLNLKKKG